MMTEFRSETDLLGAREVPADVLWGIHTLRAIENFPLAGRPVHRGLVHGFGAVKLAAARTNHELGWADEAKFDAIQTACEEMIAGRTPFCFLPIPLLILPAAFAPTASKTS